MSIVRRSLFAKILISMLAATTIPLFISNYISYRIVGDSVQEQLVQLNQNSMNITLSSIHKYVDDLSMLALSYYGDSELMRVLTKDELQTPAEAVYVNNKLRQIYGGSPDIYSIHYKSSLTNKRFNVKSDPIEQIYLPDFIMRHHSAINHNYEYDYSINKTSGERRLQIQKYLLDHADRTYLGVTTLTLRDDTVRLLTDPLRTSDESDLFVFIRNDLQLWYTSDKGKINNNWFQKLQYELTDSTVQTYGSFTDEFGMYVYHQIIAHHLPITLVKFIPKATLELAGKQALNQSSVIQISGIVLVILFASVISYFILNRIKRILKQIRTIQMGSFDIKPAKASADELGVLEHRFQEMVTELDILWNQQYRYQLEVTQANLKMLQAQINPHFLYNTLQSIGTMAIKINAIEISDKLAELGALFRYNMDIHTEEVTLREELEHLRHYISLQKGRFGDKLQYVEKVDEATFQCMIPKLILQPIVENSIIHGIEGGYGRGTIQIKIEYQQGLTILIIDNGRGLESETIEKIRKAYNQPLQLAKYHDGIGLINVLNRLFLYFGKDFNWNIESTRYVNTTVTLNLPIKREGSDQI